MEITKEEFVEYVRIQMSGMINMFDTKMVSILSKDILTREKCLDIMNNYSKYQKQYLQEEE